MLCAHRSADWNGSYSKIPKHFFHLQARIRSSSFEMNYDIQEQTNTFFNSSGFEIQF